MSILELEEKLGITENDKIECPYDCEECPYDLTPERCEELYEEFLEEKLATQIIKAD